MAEGFLGNLMSGIFPQNQRDLDEEERRMIEELRAAGAYVPQERPVNYLQYGGGRRRDENLAAMRAAIQPEKKRRTDDIMDARGAALRQRQALEKFNQEQKFKQQIARQNRANAVKDEARRQMLGQQQQKADAGFEEWKQRSVLSPDFVKKSGREYYDQNINTMTPRQRAELEVLNRAATPALTAQTQLESAQNTLATQQAAKELADAVRNALPPNYANLLANKQAISVELENALNQTRLAVAQSPLARQLEESKMDKSLMTLELEKANLRYQKELYKDVPALRDQLKLQRALQKTNELYKNIANTVESGIVNAIEGAIQGTKTLGEVANSVFTQISRTLLQFGVNSLLSILSTGLVDSL